MEKTLLNKFQNIRKFELNAFTDAASQISKIASKALGSAGDTIDEAKKLAAKAKRQFKALDSLQSKMDKIHINYVDKAGEASKEFGIAPTQIEGFQKADRLYFYVTDKIRDAQNDLKPFM